MCDNDTVIIYQWDTQHIIDELTDFVIDTCSMISNDKQVIVGTRNGSLQLFSNKE